MAKNFLLQASQIRNLLPVPIGGCIATDMITVGGNKVGYMYREATDGSRPDSGWRFMAGSEPQEYMDNPDNHAVYDVNTIANYDPDIIPFIYSPVGSTFGRKTASAPLLPLDDTKPSGFADGDYQITKQWLVHLPQPCCVRSEPDCLVIWRTGLTLRISALKKWLSNREKLLAGIRSEMSPSALHEDLIREGKLIRHSYEVTEYDPQHNPPEYPCLMSHTITDGHWLMMAIYCDTPEALNVGKLLHRSVAKV